jgi:putative transposase
MLILMPPEEVVSLVIGYLKGRYAIQIAETYIRWKKNGATLLRAGYFVSTSVADGDKIREYIR